MLYMNRYFKFGCLFLLLSAAPFWCNYAQKIVLDPSMVYDEAGAEGVSSRLVDEQAIAGDPASGKGGVPSSPWFPGYKMFYYPGNIVIDLKGLYKITSIYLYNDEGKTHINVSTGAPFNWDFLYTEYVTPYKSWVKHDVNITTRYLRLSQLDFYSHIQEIVLYGSSAGPIASEPAAQEHDLPLMEKFIGMNALANAPMDKVLVAGLIREYHQWFWDEGNSYKFGAITSLYPGYPNNQNKWDASYNGVNYDNYYSSLKNAGIICSPCIKESVDWLNIKATHKPILSGADSRDPHSYAAHADHMYQYAARYGNTKITDSKLKLGTGQPRNSGLNTVSYVEDWNEQDDWWEDSNSYFHPYQYAAMASADYDGHLGAMGTTVGVKNADPTMKMAMSGIARPNIDYVKSMKAWADKYRGGSFPGDVLNFHTYSTDVGGQDNPTVGVSPESDKLKEKMQKITDYRSKYLPDKEVWLSEFGYDTDPNSKFRAPAIASFTQEEVQGQWLVRSFLALAAAKVDKAFMFMFDDPNSSSSQQFSTSGLVSSQATGFVPKTSWYYIYTLKNVLTGMKFNKEELSGNPKVNVYSFKSAAGKGGAYVLWCNTSDGSTVDNFDLTLNSAATATLVSMKKGDTDGVPTPLTIASGKVKVNVSERPVYVKVDNIVTELSDNESITKEDLFKVYPTITDDEVTVDITGPIQEDVKVSIFDSQGILKLRSVFGADKKKLLISIGRFSQGMYILKAETAQGVFTQKISKF